MKKINTIFIALFLLTCTNGLAQKTNIRERVYLHLNSPSLLVGENLLFSAYCNSDLTGKPSPLSRILYVELIGEKGVIAQKKVSLMHGRGQSDIFLPSTLPTGTYQLLAYTRWMKNFDDYFQTSVEVINPFEKYEVPEYHVDQPLIKLYPAGGSIIGGIENTIGFIINSKNNYSGISGKVMDDAGQVVLTFRPNRYGIGHFNIIPESGGKYRILIEDDQGTFQFIDLPQITNKGVVISAKALDTTFKITVNGHQLNGTLSVENSQEVLFQQAVNGKTDVTLNKENLPVGLFLVRVNQDGQERGKRWFYNGSLSPTKKSSTRNYGTRKEVNLSPVLPEGNYSVSVRKKAQYLASSLAHATISPLNFYFSKINDINRPISPEEIQEALDDILLLHREKEWFKLTDTVKYLPELRDEIISGRVVSEDNIPLVDKKVAMSFSEPPFQTQTALTNTMGQFEIHFESPAINSTSYIQLLDSAEGHQLKVQLNWLAEYPEFDYSPPHLDSLQIMEVIERSLRIQVENAYQLTRQDSILERKPWDSQFMPYNAFFILDDYNRFKTLREHFIEYIPTARVRRGNFMISKQFSNPTFNAPALVMVDGVPIADTLVLASSPYKIRSIGIVNNRFYLGPLAFDGVVNFETFEGKLGGLRLPDHVIKQPIIGLALEKKYFFPNYEEDTRVRTPDQRDQLFWEPRLTVTEDTPAVIRFHTSDLTGLYEMVIEGFGKDGRPVTFVEEFMVE
ncbi:MAG: hypothetical protein OEX02_05855 [Cyclobacteriaceae bacterium]|nr:hypothetical protein [Cyclobacteriaceae bacterium]